MDISDARELVGYAPQDDLTEENPKLKDLNLRDEVGCTASRTGRSRAFGKT